MTTPLRLLGFDLRGCDFPCVGRGSQRVAVDSSRSVIVRRGDLVNPAAINGLVAEVASRASADASGLRLDLTGVTRADSKTAAGVLAAALICRRRGVKVAIEVSPAIKLWLDLLGVWPVLRGAA